MKSMASEPVLSGLELLIRPLNVSACSQANLNVIWLTPTNIRDDLLRRLIGLNLLLRLQNVSAIIDTSYLRGTFKMISIKVRYD